MSFADEVKSFQLGSMQQVEKVRNLIILKLFTAVIMGSPVDTGRFRANWMITEGEPSNETKDDVDESGSLTIKNVMNFLEGGKHKVVFLTNNLPYAERLEYEGWSEQAKQGMVRINVARFDRFVSEAIQESK